MNKTFITKGDDVVASQLISRNPMNVGFANTSISVIPNDVDHQYAYKDHQGAINIDRYIIPRDPYRCSNLDVPGIENKSRVNPFAVLVTDLTISNS